ncbi:hypothetical protein F443_13635 [Phytophthora nicotianae P1569]|uniref:Uncharacterized protein n=1 Tax=Phytophthora nicotianae P1569 TaxID=1317065 RepID=V9EPC1_PHYNI|nr:hypothetical protein F443_13635 [Phytophthora nicotianae P1569]
MQNLPELKRLQRLDEAENNALKKLCQHSSIFTGCGKPTEQTKPRPFARMFFIRALSDECSHRQQTQDDRMIVFRHEAQSDNMGVEVMNLADSDQSEADE